MKRMTPSELNIKEKFLGRLWIVRLFGFVCLFIFPFMGIYMVLKDFFLSWGDFFTALRDALTESFQALKWGYETAVGMIFMKGIKRKDV